MKIQKSMMWLAVMALLPLTSCGESSSSSAPGSHSAPASSAPSSSASSSSSESSSSSSLSSSSSMYTPDLSESVNVKMGVFYNGKVKSGMAFDTGSPAMTKTSGSYVAPDGNTYEVGDFKPAWAQLQTDLNFVIKDCTDPTSTTTKDALAYYITKNFTDATNGLINIGQGPVDGIVTEGTNNSTILNLNDYLGKMPHLSSFLSSNPALRKMMLDGNGKMFYAPYFDGNDDIERMLQCRIDWVKDLLDGTLPGDLDTTAAPTAAFYTKFAPATMDTHISVVKADGSGVESIAKKYVSGENVIDQQNALSSRTGATYVKALRDYIDKTYSNYYGTSRSNLFVGQNAAYDVDELVALYRCVLTNPAFLTGSASKVLIPLGPRAATLDRTPDLWRFLQCFGVRGVDSRNGFLYVGTDGKIHDCRGDAAMRDAVGKMNLMYQEHLIQQDFENPSNKYGSDVRKTDLEFSGYDYNQTQTTINDDTTFAALNEGKAIYSSIIPAVADWEGKGNYVHFTESWRSVKTDGWFITAKTAEDSKTLDRCLAIFDYLWTDAGNQLMSFGPKGYLEQDASGKVVTFDYQGRQVPKFSAATLNELKTLSAGSFTDYARQYIGSTLGIGYVKDQGGEYQAVPDKAKTTFGYINKAIALGVLQHPNFQSNNVDHLYDIIPTNFPFTAQENEALASDPFKPLTNVFSSSKGGYNVWLAIYKTGFGTYKELDFSEANYLTTVNTTMKLTNLLEYYNDAYTRFKAL